MRGERLCATGLPRRPVSTVVPVILSAIVLIPPVTLLFTAYYNPEEEKKSNLKNSGISIREKTYLKHKFYFVRMKEMYCEPGG